MAKSNKELIDLLNNESFLRWLRGRANNDETIYWENWVNDDLNREDLVHHARIISGIPFNNRVVKKGEIKKELDNLNKKIDIENDTSFDDFESVLSFINKRKKRNLYQIAIAAAVAILIGILSFFYFSSIPKSAQDLASHDIITVPYGKRDVLQLSDGSKIIVNANSELKYAFTGNKKSKVNIWLDGEAYFSITHQKNRVLIIHTRDGIVRDLGTRFDINTRFNKTRVVLVDGSLEVRKGSSDESHQGFYKMIPGQLASFTHSQGITTKKVNTKVYTSWIHYKLTFDNTPVSQVLQSIEEYYGIKIKINDKNLMKQRISGSIKNTDLATVLKGLSEILNVKIVNNQNNIVTIHK